MKCAYMLLCETLLLGYLKLRASYSGYINRRCAFYVSIIIRQFLIFRFKFFKCEIKQYLVV